MRSGGGDSGFSNSQHSVSAFYLHRRRQPAAAETLKSSSSIFTSPGQEILGRRRHVTHVTYGTNYPPRWFLGWLAVWLAGSEGDVPLILSVSNGPDSFPGRGAETPNDQEQREKINVFMLGSAFLCHPSKRAKSRIGGTRA